MKGTYHHGDLPAALVAAGIEILERDGLDAMTLRAAARAVGVSHAAPARHFADAGAFLAAVAAAGFDRLTADLAAAGSGAGGEALDAFQAMGQAYVRFALHHPQWYRAIFHPALADAGRHPDLLATSEAAFDQLRGGVARAIAAGAMRDADVDTIALTAWATVHGISTLLIDGLLAGKGYQGSGEEMAELVTGTLYLGLRPEG
jgi:AcrR family transcriptional regulator